MNTKSGLLNNIKWFNLFELFEPLVLQFSFLKSLGHLVKMNNKRPLLHYCGYLNKPIHNDGIRNVKMVTGMIGINLKKNKVAGLRFN